MIFIDYAGETIALLLADPERGQEVKVTPRLPAAITESISNQKSRRNYARTFLHDLEYTVDLRDAKSSTNMRMWLLRLKGETVAVPMWNDFVEIGAAVTAGDTALPIAYGIPVRSGADWIILSDDLGTFEIVTADDVTTTTLTLHGAGATLNWPKGSCAYPLLFGKLIERPKWDASLTDEWISGVIKIEENSSFSRRLSGFQHFPAALPVVGAGIPDFPALPLWTITPSRVKMLDYTEARVLYRAIGFLRQQQQYVYPQANARGLEMEFDCRSRFEIAAVERYFTACLATVKKLMVPTFNGDLRLTQDTPVGGDAKKLPIEDSRYTDASYVTAHPGMPFLALVEPYSGELDDEGLSNVEPVHVDTIDITGVHAHVDLGLHKKDETILSHLLLVCFAESKLEWRYLTDGRAVARIKFLELPDEYASPQADLPEPVYCYRFTEKLAAPIVSRFTNYEKSLTIGGETFVPGPFDHSAIKISLRPGETKTELISWGGNSAGNPLAKFMPFDLEAGLIAEILEGDGANLATPLKLIFSGDVMNLNKKGPDWKAECAWGGKMFKRKIPHFLMQKSDNHVQFSRPTQLDPAPFRYGATIISVSGATLVCGPLGGSPDPTTTADNFFGNGGYITIGAGANAQGRSILESTVAGGHITLVLDRPLRAMYGAGATFNLWPGYDGSIGQCISRFDNQVNHGGHPFLTDTGPQIKAVEAKQVAGGKKG